MSGRLQQIKERESKATKGPWITFGIRIGSFAGGRAVCGMLDGTDTSAKLMQSLSGESWEQANKDELFIAHSRADIPWLLEERERLVRRIEEAKLIIAASITALDDRPHTKNKAEQFLRETE